ncbi:bifunctional DNA primase/polymerase [Streptoalloteichus hindustanus]|uniref:Bifunctional DNA primase/polymerase, N-terminal n=1 Tax=Streptoalloteichus hindustanus TaxID=2017 RepID=A0A1M4VWE4_STRHI|nr:bifunctional DNA primase/polymerase [Streptoalloteichus hindustanus]SHE73267.1 Bifunctional DNA primase/polymerase, N-terminal [Streptoalloteichus hindustanus]
MEWSDSWRGAFRIELRAEAIGMAWRGWPVLPGTYPAGLRWEGRDGARNEGPVPVHQDWAQRVGTDPEQVASWWSGRPYTLLVATGFVVDAVEVGGELGRATAAALRAAGVPVPIAATPTGRWLFLIASEPGSGRDSGALRSGLGEHQDITLHARGSWIPLPPSPFQHGVVHWRVRPQVCGWQLPDIDVVRDALLSALHSTGADRSLTASRT